MAKEFTPAARPVSAGTAINTRPGGPYPRTSFLPPSGLRSSNRAFSAAVGSEVRRATSTVEAPVHVTLGEIGQTASYQPGASWATRPITHPGHPGSSLATNERFTIASQGHRSSSQGLRNIGAFPHPQIQGFRPRNDSVQGEGGGEEMGVYFGSSHQGLRARSDSVQGESGGEETGVYFGPSHRREYGAISRQGALQPVQYAHGTWYPHPHPHPHPREPTTPHPREPTTGTISDLGGPFLTERQQRRVWNQPPPLHGMHSHYTESAKKNDATYGRDGIHDHVTKRNQQIEEDGAAKETTRSRIRRATPRIRREPRVQTRTNSARHDLTEKDSPVEDGNCAQQNLESAAGKDLKTAPASCPLISAPADPVYAGDGKISQETSPRLLPCTKDQESSSSNGSVNEVLETDELSPRQSEGQWPGLNTDNTDRAPQQVPQQVQKDGGSSLENLGKLNLSNKSKKKEERYPNRAGPKHLLGSAPKDPSRGKLDAKSSSSRSISALCTSLRNFSLEVSAFAVRIIVWHLTRLHLVRRLVALMSFSASVGASCLGVVMTIMSWLLMLWIRVHSLALKEVTGSIHVAVCFLFPYSFQYLVSLADDWAPHWLPACVWYSFLMQIFCSSNHLHKHSMSSHLVPALGALLPVAFLCEVPSGRSYLLALNGSELVLLSFSLAAVRLRCLLSPFFLFSWSTQVIAIATFGSSTFLQYGQLIVSLASLHTVSMVDVTLNSRFYHARYRAGMSLTDGFRAIITPSPAMLMLR